MHLVIALLAPRLCLRLRNLKRLGSCGGAAGLRAFDLAAVDLVEEEDEGAAEFDEDEEGAEAVGGA